jgi:hypothetical protein
MRLHTLALASILSLAPGTCAFAPIHTPKIGSASTSTSSLSLKESDIETSVEQAKKGLLSVFAASTIFLASSATGSFVDPAFAATNTATAPPATATPAKGKVAAAPVVDPVASEKAALETAKSQLASSSVEVGKAKKVLGEANTALAKASDIESASEKKLLASKKALIAANDKLADAKAKEGRNGGDLNAMKEVESLASKVGR